MTAPATTSNPYDGRAFFIDYTDPKEPGAGYLWPVDGSIPPARIRGWSLAGRWTLDPKNTGNSDDYVFGPYCRTEVFEAEGKRGDMVGTEAGEIPVWKHDDGTPWTAAECLAVPLPGGPIKAGPNSAPLNAPKYKQVGDQIAPNVPEAPPAAQTPAPIASAVPTGAPLPAQHVAVHQSWFQRLEDALKRDASIAKARAEALFHEVKAKL